MIKSKAKTIKSKTNSKKAVITVARYDNHEMAYVLVNEKTVYSGNYWDFHSGCHGTKVAGYELKGLRDSGIDSLATALKSKMTDKGIDAKIIQKDLTSEEYNKFSN